MNINIQAIILAAGRGTRMQAKDRNKVMFEVGGKPMIAYPVERLKHLGIIRPIVVVGFAKESVMRFLGDTVQYAEQEKALGTADAVKCALPLVDPTVKHVLVLYGDHATFYTEEILTELMTRHASNHAAMTLITTHAKNPSGYGRILRRPSGEIAGIVEEKNATEEQKRITEINTGNAIYSVEFLRNYLPKIKINEVSGEYYFTDIVSIGVAHGEHVSTFLVDDERVALGVNTPEQLLETERALHKRTA